MTTHSIVTLVGTDISSRTRARWLREQIVDSGDECLIDFGGVRSVSHSFADECFAVLVVEHGETWFREHIKLLNCPTAIRETILEAILQRLESLHPTN